MSEPIRLAKRVAEIYRCSRREAELLIEGGRIRVDGEIVDVPQFRVGDQKIERLPGDLPEAPVPVTLLLHKAADIDAEALLAQLLRAELHAAGDASGIVPHRRHFVRQNIIAPLPASASGLLVLSQDWRLSEKLRRDGDLIEQEWQVEIDGARLDDTLTALRRSLPTAKVSWQSEKRLRFALKSWRPGQIEAACSAAGLNVVAAKRLRLGRVALAGLAPGEWRYLGDHERF